MTLTEPMTVPRSDNAPVELLYGPRVTLPTGLVLGSVDRAGCMWVIDTLEGWGQVGTTGTYTQRSYRHGAWVDRAFYPPRIIVITGRIHAPNQGSMAERYAAVSAAVDRLLGSVPFDIPDEVVVTEGGRARLVRARQDGEQFADIQDPGDTALFSVQLVAPDPRRLSAGAGLTASTGLPSSVGGLTIPFTIPFTIDAVATSGHIEIENRGNAVAPASLRIDGPCQRPEVRHVETGTTMVFDLILEEGQWLEVDLDARTVLLNGQASRRGRMRGGWFDLAPGRNTVLFNALDFNLDARLTLTWRDADR